ncbi:MAG: hypothetical protein ACREN7_00060 [Candidatus Dormibacteria bacterium]
MSKAPLHKWREFEEANRRLAEQASLPGAQFTWSCPCGVSLSVPTGPTGPEEVQNLSNLHMEQAHPGLMDELADLARRGIPEEFGSIFLENWKKGVRRS